MCCLFGDFFLYFSYPFQFNYFILLLLFSDFKVAYATSTAVYSLEFAGKTPVKTELFTSNEDIQSFDMYWQQGWVVWSNGTGHVKTNTHSEDLSEYILTLKPGMLCPFYL